MRNSPRTNETGTALLITMNVVVMLSALAAAFLVVAAAENREHVAADARMRAFWIAEAGLNEALLSLKQGGDGNLGSEAWWIPYSGGRYRTVTVGDGNGSWRAVAIAELGEESVALEGIVTTDTSNAFFSGAAFSSGSMAIGGSATVDSYDSGTGMWSSQLSGSYLTRPVANSEGDVGSNADITLGTAAAVFGNVIPGVGMTLAVIGANYVSGSTTPRSSAMSLTPVTIPPSVAALPATPLVTSSGLTTLSPGYYNLGGMRLSGTAAVIVSGPATIVASSMEVLNSASFTVDPSNGPVYVYCSGKIVITDSGFVGSANRVPWDLMMFATTDNTTGYPTGAGNPALPLSLAQNSQTYGVLYAPNGVVSATNSAQIHGSVYAKRVRLLDLARIHFDEMLRRVTIPKGGGEVATRWVGNGGSSPALSLRIVSWRKVSPTAPVSAPEQAPTGSGAPMTQGG